MPPSKMPTTSTCNTVLIFVAARYGLGSRELLAWNVAQGDAFPACLDRKHGHLFSALPLNDHRQRARILELVVELRPESRRVRAQRFVHRRGGGSYFRRLRAPGGLDRVEHHQQAAVC